MKQESKTLTATWDITLNTECPHCNNEFDILTQDDFDKATLPPPLYTSSSLDIDVNVLTPSLTDFLRSRSYALPYKGINLFDAGIAIRKKR